MKLSFVLIPFIVLTGCLPNRLVPHDFSIGKNNLEAYIVIDSVTIALQNVEIKSDHYVFGMEVQNKSEKPIFIDQKKIQKFADYHPFDEVLKIYPNQEITTAMTPSQVTQFFRAKKRDAQAAGIFLFLVGAAIMTNDLIKDAKDNSKEYCTKEDEKKSWRRDLVTSTSLAATDVLTEVAFAGKEGAETELNHLPSELFDGDVIHPGESYYGKVLFRKPGEVQKYQRIIYPMEGKRLLFDFRKATAEEKRFLFEQGK